MTSTSEEPAAKIHPATREILSDDPMEVKGFEVAGDPQLMLRMLVEEYARMGCDAKTIIGLARDPNYQAFHSLFRVFGEDEFRQRVMEIIARCGVIRVKTKEVELISEHLVQIESPKT